MEVERHEIRVFCAVVAAAGFSRAAERLGVTQSAVSQAIANLEFKIGTQLLKRSSPPKLTEAGIRFLGFAETVIKEESEVLSDLDAIKTGARSVLSLACSSAVNRRFGIELLQEFCQRNSLTRLKVDVAPSRELVHGVAEGRWEIGFGPFQTQMPGHFTVLECFEEVRHLVIGKRHPELDQLAEDPRALLSRTPLLTSFLEEPARRPGGERLRDVFGSIWEITHLDLRLALVADGKGVTYVSDLILGDLDDFTRIGGLPFSSIPRRVGLYYLKDRPLSQAATRFLALCKVRWPPR